MDKEHLDCKSQLWQKVNGQLSRSQGQPWKSQLPEVNVNLEMTSAMTRSNDVSDDATRADVAR